MALKANQPIIIDGLASGGIQLVKNQPNILFHADRSGQGVQTIPSGVSTKVLLPIEKLDFGGFYNVATSEWIPAAGIYNLTVHCQLLLLDNTEELLIKIMKDGVPIYFDDATASANNLSPSEGTSGLVSSTGVEVFTFEVEHNHGSDLDISDGVNQTYMYGSLHTQSLEA